MAITARTRSVGGLRLRAALTFTIALIGVRAHAQTCTFTISNMNFGSPAIVSGGVVDTTATISGGCSNYAATNICVGLDAGSGGASGTTRFMTGPSSTLRYNFYQHGARTIPWGSRTTPTLGGVPYRTLPGTSTFSYTSTVYGRLQSGQSTAALGSYSSSFSGVQAEAYTLTSGTDCVTSPKTSSQYTTVSVLASVGSDCTVSASPLNFGTSTGLISAAVDATTSLNVACTSTTAYTVGLGNGGTGTGPTAREMKSGTNSITYGLYRDAARAQPWSAVTGGMASGTGTGTAQSYTVCGRVAAAQSPPPGAYSDTVVITVSY